MPSQKRKLNKNEKYNNTAVHHYLSEMWISEGRNNARGCLPVFL